MASPTTSAIYKVDDDILLSIFDTLTSEMPVLDQYMERMDRALAFIQAASQVCQRWRGLLLASLWIWGRLVDLDRQCGPQPIKWIKEVIRRAGSASLWIHGHVIEEIREGYQPLEVPSLFLLLLECSWERIEKLSVLVCLDHRKIVEDIQFHFLRRAPILKIFEVRFIDNEDYMSLDTFRPGSSRSLFADYAPSLQAINAGQMPYTSDASWLPNLRKIDSFPNNSNLKDIFDILQHTPRIERIVFNGQRPENRLWPNQVAFPKLSLPNLSSIEVNSIVLEVLAGILEHTTPGGLSCLRFNVIDCGAVNSDHAAILSLLKKNLPFYISSFFTSNITTLVTILLAGTSFKLCVAVKGREVQFPFGFDISFAGHGLADPRDWNSLLACLLDAFIVSLSGNLSALEFATELRIPMITIQPPIIPKSYSFFDLFRHVQVIQTSEHSGKALLALSHLDRAAVHDNPPHVLFPQLHTVRLITNKRKDWPLCTDLTPFFITRKRIGFPVAKLDLTECSRSLYAHNLRDLDDVDGLEVVWTKRRTEAGEEDEICSYVCGSGNPDRLKNLINI